MTPEVPHDLLALARRWDDLHRRERSQLGKALRRLGLTYGEIRGIIPVPKGTLSCWCRDIELTPRQIAAIRERTSPGSRKGIPVDTQWRRRRSIEKIREQARNFAEDHIDDAFFIAGVSLYWGEGSKTRSDLSLANADPRALRLFIDWVRAYHDASADFVLKINLHAGNDEPAARDFWRDATGLGDATFYRTYIKPDGTGHRKNHLPYGVCQVRVRRCADHWHRTMEWIAVVASHSWRIDGLPR
jgi:hypothetical protein